MKFSVERDALLSALSHAHRIVARTDAIPIYSTVLMDVGFGRIGIKATTTEMIAETSCVANVEAQGRIAIPLAPLVELLRRLPAGTAMSFAKPEDSDEIAIRYRRSSLSLPTVSPESFPVFEMTGEIFEMDVEAEQLARLVETPSHVADAASPWAFGVGVHLHFVPATSSLVGVATDQKRLTIVTLPVSEGAKNFPPITIAIKPIGEIVKLARESKAAALRMQVTERLLSVSDGGTTLTMKLIEARFPDYTRVVPDEFSGIATLASAEFGSALQRTLILADDKDRIVRCQIADGALSISARSQKAGAIEESVEVDGGEGTCFGFNARMALEALAALDTDVIELSHGGPGLPIAMRAKSNADVLCLVMPLKI